LTALEQVSVSCDAVSVVDKGDYWTFVAVLPETGFIQSTHTGRRTLVSARQFATKIKAQSNGQAPLFHSDSWCYETTLTETYGSLETPPYKGRGRKPHAKWIPDARLRYVQVQKIRSRRGKITKVTTRIVLGDELEILDTLDNAQRCKTVNTDYVESRNGKYRKDTARLIRRTLCHSKKFIFHKAAIDFCTQVFNYTIFNTALKLIINDTAKLFKQKYTHRTPAMAEGIIDKILTIKELICIRPRIIIA
jgi:IS1 family transposase